MHETIYIWARDWDSVLNKAHQYSFEVGINLKAAQQHQVGKCPDLWQHRAQHELHSVDNEQ